MQSRSGKRTKRKIPHAPATAIAEQPLMGRRTIGHGDITPEDMNLGGDKKNKDPNTKKLDKLVSISQVTFQDRYIPKAMAWTTMVLIPKVGGGYTGIGLVKVI